MKLTVVSRKQKASTAHAVTIVGDRMGRGMI